MTALVWEESFSVGVPEIDTQHRGLLDLINRTADEPVAGAGGRRYLRTIEALVDYAQVHFSTEERLMREAGYDGLARHQEEHVAFAEEVRRLQTLFEAGSPDVQPRIAAFLREWFVAHVLGSDQAYAPLLRRAAAARRSPGR